MDHAVGAVPKEPTVDWNHEESDALDHFDVIMEQRG